MKLTLSQTAGSSSIFLAQSVARPPIKLLFCNPSQRDAETLAWTQKMLADDAKRAALAKLNIIQVHHDMEAINGTHQLAALFDQEATNAMDEEEDASV